MNTHEHAHELDARPAGTAGSGASARDPVCGMNVDTAAAKHHTNHEGIAYYFCCAGCRDKFLADPAKYLTGEVASSHQAHGSHDGHGGHGSHHGHGTPTMEPLAPGTIWTCPMHPEIRQDKPGACPKCGMALEPLHATSPIPVVNPELAVMRRRFWVTVPISAVLLADAMGRLGLPAWIDAILASVSVLWGAAPFFARGWASLINRSLNMFTLIALGTGVAYLYSLAATLFPSIFPATFRGADGRVPVYFEAASVITTLVLLGQVLELRARAQTGGAIRALLDLAPKMARRVRHRWQ